MYGSFVVHAQFTAVLRFGGSVSEQSLAIHTADDLRMSEDVSLFQRCAAQFYAKPNPNPNRNLSPKSARAVQLPGEAAIVPSDGN